MTALFERFTVFWTVFGPDSPVLMPLPDGEMHYYDLTEDTSFPVYISGKQLEEFDDSQFDSLEVTPMNMVAGALLGCRPPRAYLPFHGPSDLRPLLSDYLDRYSKDLGYKKLEDLVLELSSILRSTNGSGASIAVLKNSENLNVNFLKILNDLLLDLWHRLAERDDSKLPEAVLEFYAYLNKVKIDELHPESIEWFNYARAVVLLYFDVTNIHEISAEVLTEAILRNDHPGRRERLNRLRQERRFDRRLF